MIALGFGVIWIGYSVSFTGYCWIRGYNLSFKEIVWPAGFYTGQWPPPLVTDTSTLIPTGQSGSSAAGTSAATAAGGNPASDPTGTVAGGHGR